MTTVEAREPVAQQRLFGLPISAVNYDQVIDLVHQQLDDDASGMLTIDATNTMGLAASRSNPRLTSAMTTYDHLLPDGRPLLWTMRWKETPLEDTVAGPHLVERLLSSLTRPVRIGLVGTYDEEYKRIEEEGRNRFPHARFVVHIDVTPGDITPDTVREATDRLRANGVQLVFVCLGVPRQYYWTALAKEQSDALVCISVGGAFSYLIGNSHVPHKIIQRAGLWWLHRLVREPRRLLPRYLKYNSLFVWYLVRDSLKGGPIANTEDRRQPAVYS